jgi:hypothetical protein
MSANFYEEVKPYLSRRGRTLLSTPQRAVVFVTLKPALLQLLPMNYERRSATTGSGKTVKLHHILHLWLLAMCPFRRLLFLLTVAHVIVALDKYEASADHQGRFRLFQRPTYPLRFLQSCCHFAAKAAGVWLIVTPEAGSELQPRQSRHVACVVKTITVP